MIRVSRLIQATHVFSREALILLLFMAASATTLNIFMQTRGLEEGSRAFGFSAMLDGSAELPFVKRQLLPQVANWLSARIPPDEQARFVEYHLDKHHLEKRYFSQARYRHASQDDWTPGYALKYHIVYLMMFGSLLGTIYLLRGLSSAVTPNQNSLAPLLPAAFVLLLPLAFMHGSFFYDFSELFFLSALLLTAIKDKYHWWLILLPLAVANKETAIFAPLLYAPIVWTNCRTMLQRSFLALSIVIAGSVFWFIMSLYSGNPGGTTQWHWAGNLLFWSQPRNYFLWHDFYAPLLPFPRGFNLFLILALVPLLFLGWGKRPRPIRLLFWVALALNLPLFLLFTYRDEIRNLSMLYLPLYLLATSALLAEDKAVEPT